MLREFSYSFAAFASVFCFWQWNDKRVAKLEVKECVCKITRKEKGVMTSVGKRAHHENPNVKEVYLSA